MKRRGFTLIELLVVIAIVALLIGILLPALGEARKTAKLVLDLNNLKQLGTATNSYATDYQDKNPTFSWELNQPEGVAMGTGPFGSKVAAAAAQAIWIINERGGRDMAVPPNWIPHVLYSHLPLQDYLASRLPEKLVVSTADYHRNKWQDWRGFEAGEYVPNPAPNGKIGDADRRWPYSSSFEAVVALYDRNQSRNIKASSGQTVSRRIRWGGSQSTYTTPGDADTGATAASEVTFPSQKVLMHDGISRHFGRREMFYGYPEARVTVLMFDSSADVRSSGDANFGWDPHAPREKMGIGKFFAYEWSFRPLEQWEPPPRNGTFTDNQVAGYYKWTRGGLRGLDFGGSEIDTGQPRD